MQNLEKWYRYLTCKAEIYSVEKKIYGYQGGRGAEEQLGDWNQHIYTTDTMYKIDD